MNYTPIIGLEIHVELKTKSKMFCGCDAEHFRVKPNTHTCPVCLGLPGALPVANKQAIEWCQLIGLALNCNLAKESKFDRKNYFYPDLPKSYQISQYDQPFCENGFITLDSGKKIGVTRVHMEEDTAKNSHQTINGEKVTLVDFNRSSVPLVEIVSEPDFRNAEEADEYLKKIRRIIRHLGVSDCDMEKGSMRLEVNMSLATSSSLSKRGSRGVTSDGLIFPNYKVEVKNINSFRYAKSAIEYEFKRQLDLLNQGITPDQETRGYQESVNKTISQRSKEDAQDYRYFPDPDLPPMYFTDEDFEKLNKQLPELPDQIKARFKKEYGINSETANFIVEDPELTKYFQNAVGAIHELPNINIKPNDIAKAIKNKKFDWTKLQPKEFIQQMEKEKSSTISDDSSLKPIIEQIIKDNPNEVERFKSGDKKLIGFFMGQCMKALKGKGDARSINKLLIELLK